jgi:hypothetical protein
MYSCSVLNLEPLDTFQAVDPGSNKLKRVCPMNNNGVILTLSLSIKGGKSEPMPILS